MGHLGADVACRALISTGTRQMPFGGESLALGCLWSLRGARGDMGNDGWVMWGSQLKLTSLAEQLTININSSTRSLRTRP